MQLHRSNMIEIEVTSHQQVHEIATERLGKVAHEITSDAGFNSGFIDISVVDDVMIHEVNRRWLQHDYPTDVLSFVFDRNNNRLEGEVLASVETAATKAPDYGWSIEDELFLYVIHGVLHLIGCDDKSPEQEMEMRQEERRFLARNGLDNSDR